MKKHPEVCGKANMGYPLVFIIIKWKYLDNLFFNFISGGIYFTYSLIIKLKRVYIFFLL